MRLDLFTLLVGACGDPDPCARPAPVEVEVGGGEDAFTALDSGDPLGFEFGPQGGYHVFVSVQGVGFAPGTGDVLQPDDPIVEISIFSAGQVLADFSQVRQLAQEGGSDALIGQLIVLEHPDPTQFDGAEAELSLTVTDRCGATASDNRTVVLTLDALR